MVTVCGGNTGSSIHVSNQMSQPPEHWAMCRSVLTNTAGPPGQRRGGDDGSRTMSPRGTGSESDSGSIPSLVIFGLRVWWEQQVDQCAVADVVYLGRPVARRQLHVLTFQPDGIGQRFIAALSHVVPPTTRRCRLR